jgi:hypothetical protein
MAFSKQEAVIRITAVTAFVAIVGAISGALAAGVASLALEVTRVSGPGSGVGHSATLGAISGAVLGAPVAMLLLRNAPLWRATIETAGAAGLGAVAGSFAPVPYGWAAGAVVLSLLAAWRLRRAFRAPAVATSAETSREPQE